MILERPISIVACSRHSSVACVSAGRGGRSDTKTSMAVRRLLDEDVGAVDAGPQARMPNLLSYPAGADSPGGGLDDL